ncbi:MAG: NAD-binding protein [Nitrospirae bacterium]|nr:NAD-binding protein [Nitrospirota bacterium]
MLYKRLIGISVTLTLIIASGISGYIAIEGWSPLEALYMTVITLSSVGFMEVHPLSGSGRVFTIALILCGSGVLIYGISLITAFIVEGELTDVLRRKRMNKKIEKLRSHYIVCGADQTGRYVIEELVKTRKEFLVIEKDPEKVRVLMDQDIPCIQGDATHDSVLLQAGIKNARGFITSLHSDAENLFVVITAKRLNPTLRVISKAIEEESEQKIRMVGADGVVMPNSIGGLRMVSEMIRPSVVNFLDIMLRAKDRTIRVEEIDISKGSPFAARTLDETGILNVEGVTVVALRDKTLDTHLFNPSRTTALTEDNTIIVMGEVEKINALLEKARPAGQD